MKMWIARDRHLGATYDLYATRPKISLGASYYFGDGFLQSYCQEEFQRLTKLKLRQMELREIEIDIRLVPQKAKVRK